MKIKTLADIKREMGNRRPYYIHNHRVSEFIGQIRVANVIQTNGVYLHVYNEPLNRISLCNGNKGSWLEYGKAKDWEIDSLTGHCILYQGEHSAEHLIMEISFFDDECVKELEVKWNCKAD